MVGRAQARERNAFNIIADLQIDDIAANADQLSLGVDHGRGYSPSALLRNRAVCERKDN
jgi:hypothetical protein